MPDKFHIVANPPHPGVVRVLMHDDGFAVLSRSGNAESAGLGEQGLYYKGTRYVSRVHLYLGDHDFLLLSSAVLHDNLLLAIDLSNPDVCDRDLSIPYGTLHVLRSKFLHGATCYERLQVSNYGPRAVDVLLRVRFEADFVDIFEVRGTPREARGESLPPRVVPNATTLGYRGLDGITRTTRFEFAPLPETLTEDEASFRVHLEVKQTKELYTWTTCDDGSAGPVKAYETAFADAKTTRTQARANECSVRTNNEQFNEWIRRSAADLRMMTAETPYGPYPYAGVPWYSTPFGRDGIWTAMAASFMNPDLAAGVLRYLAATQSRVHDADSDAEPGKIVHEMREGEMAALREVPFGRYYGSIDSTPLFLMLAARYYDRTSDRALVESLWPNFLAALDWIDRSGDMDGDGFVEYGRRSKDGLLQQGWKDSNDSVFHHDGTLAEAPIALCEVQGYVYAARRGMAQLARALGLDALAAEQEQRAEDLANRFDAAFWCDDLDTYALALDGKKLPCRVRTSNAGHCLFTRIAPPDRAARLARTLMSPELFSGWGIRTLGTSEQGYNPMSYHNGSTWPHDNAIVAAGLAAYGHKDAAARILTGLFDASLYLDLHRMPELFCGFERREGEAPTAYPVACAPQAWAAAAPFLLLEAILGLRTDAVARRVTLMYPVLPPFIDDLVVRNLRVGAASVDLRLHRYPDDVGVNVLAKTGNVEVLLVK